MSTALFENIAKEDYLSLFDEDKKPTQQVVNFLAFKKEEVAESAGVPVSSIRYDDKMPTEVRNRMQEWANLLNLVAGHFQGDVRKTTLWFTMPNPLLGYVAPRDMIRFGRYKKLLKFVVNAISENKPVNLH